MWATNLRIIGVVLGTLALYTLIANKIPQVQSEVPHALTLGANVTPEQLVSAGDQLYHGAGRLHRLSRPRHAGAESADRRKGSGSDWRALRQARAGQGVQGVPLRVAHEPSRVRRARL